VRFTSAARDPEGAAVSTVWDFRDGVKAGGPSISHTYRTGVWSRRPRCSPWERRRDLEHLPAGLQVAAYRILQEAITNVLKHAAGARAHVGVRRAQESLEVR
jgi:hypothetical protein